ncbi:MAG: hypothetical protein ACE5QV_07085, partial [Fidelibacterota bacterium]
MKFVTISRLRNIIFASAVFLFLLKFPVFGQVPDDVTLNPPTGVTQHTVTLSWSQSADTAFKEYRIYRSPESPVDTNDDLVAVITDQSTLTHTDTTLHIATWYAYKIFVVNNSGTYSPGSNEVSATTLPNYYPFFDNMESGDLKWFIPTGAWVVSDDDSYSGNYNWSDSPDGPYSTNETNILSTSIILTGSGIVMPMLSFYHRYNFEAS